MITDITRFRIGTMSHVSIRLGLNHLAIPALNGCNTGVRDQGFFKSDEKNRGLLGTILKLIKSDLVNIIRSGIAGRRERVDV